MERKLNRQTNRAFTLIELLVVIAVLAILLAMVPCAPTWSKAKAQRILCGNNLRQIDLGFLLWGKDHNDSFPMTLADTNGGTSVLLSNGMAGYFLAATNELMTPKILVCPSDTRMAAMDFTRLTITNLSYFVGLDATGSRGQIFLAGDRNITNGLAPVHSVLPLPPDRLAGWTEAMHMKQGNIGLADGSVQMLTTPLLQKALKNTGDPTNRIALPEPQPEIPP